MFGKFIGIICLFLVALVTLSSFGQTMLLAKDPEYQEMLEKLNKRYEGFFIHEQEEKRWHSARKSGIDEVKQRRQRELESRERARQNFVRTPPPDMEPARLRWEAQQKSEEEKREKLRKEFAKKRNEIERVRSSARQIPPMKEVGLE